MVLGSLSKQEFLQAFRTLDYGRVENNLRDLPELEHLRSTISSSVVRLWRDFWDACVHSWCPSIKEVQAHGTCVEMREVDQLSIGENDHLWIQKWVKEVLDLLRVQISPRWRVE